MIRTARSSVRSLNKKRCLTHLGRGTDHTIPTEAFDQVLQVQELERRLEFAPWTHEEKAGVKCDTTKGPACVGTVTVEVSHKAEYSHE